ncbi:MAG TPA: hypothetical protein VLA21_00975 [Candidatus Limnocylindria bacterium]|nr:hypothetical protein [Candidatus Limnocylindria bacterium]
MRKTFALALALLLALGAVPALGAQIDFPEGLPAKGVDAATPPELQVNRAAQAARALPVPLDQVSINNGVFTITSLGVTATAEPPFGWVGFTQNLVLQLSDYMNFFNEPATLAQWLIDNRISMLMLDLESSAEIHMYFTQDQLSQLLGDMEDPAVAEAVLAYYKEQFPGEELEVVTLGGRSYIRNVTNYDAGEKLIYFTFAGGAQVGFQLLSDGQELTEDEEDALLSVLETAVFS